MNNEEIVVNNVEWYVNGILVPDFNTKDLKPGDKVHARVESEAPDTSKKLKIPSQHKKTKRGKERR